jgi:hypothetical protein
VKFTEHDNREPKYKRMKNPVLILDPFFILPAMLLNASIKVFPLSNDANSTIDVDESGASQDVRSQVEGYVETV